MSNNRQRNEWADLVIAIQTNQFAVVFVPDDDEKFPEFKPVLTCYNRYLDIYTESLIDPSLTFVSDEGRYACVLFRDEDKGGVFITQQKFRSLTPKDLWQPEWVEIIVTMPEGPGSSVFDVQAQSPDTNKEATRG